MDMKKFDVRDKAATAEGGEYILGSEDTQSHACYMIYGILKPGEKQRLIKPGKGHEEIVLAVKGDIEMSGDANGLLEEGRAFHVAGEISIYFENKGQDAATYIIAGGHSTHGHHH